MAKILIKNASIITINEKKDILDNTDILIEDNKVSVIAPDINTKADKIIDARNKIIMPGFIQTHIHLCQTLFRGLAENKELLDWLKEKIWPFEAAHNETSTYYSALLGISELFLSGTTTVLDMGGVNYTDKIFEAVKRSGLRAFCGKAMMDTGSGIPKEILETTENSIQESLELYRKWDGAENDRIKYALAPRFILSCSDDLFYQIKDISDTHSILVHTHSYENKKEGEEVVRMKGLREFDYFDKVGLLNERFLAAHCIWVNDDDIKLMKQKHIKALHCPSSNFKLGSGMLNLKRLLDEGINVSIGADGAPCNNNLDAMKEIRTTALLQNVLNKPGAIEAYKYLELVTIEGARALGIDKETGSIETGKKADLIVLNLNDDMHSWHADEVDLPTRIVYSARSSDIETVIVDGQIVVENRKLTTLDKGEILANCKEESSKLLERAKKILSESLKGK